MKNKLIILSSALLISTLLFGQSIFAFSDVSPSHENYQAINYLERTGIISGYEDDTFRPNQNVVRAEAVKIIIAPLHENLEAISESPFPDVSSDQWFATFVKKAKDEGIISGDGNTGNFEGARNVNLAEFLKILLLANKVDLSNFQNPNEVIFNDIQDLKQWFIPYLYYASSTNLIHSDEAKNIYPGEALTRAEVAEITFRLIINLEGGDTQLYLSMAEAEMIKILQFLDNNDISNAEISATKAVSYTTNAKNLSPETPIVLAAHKIAEAFDKLVKAYRAGLNLDFAAVESNAGSAWNLANEAIGIDGSVETLAETIKNIAHDMAEDARSHQEN